MGLPSQPIVGASCCCLRAFGVVMEAGGRAFPDSLDSTNFNISSNVMSCFALPNRWSWISLSAMPRARTSRRIQSVKSTVVEQLGHAVLYWHTLARPRIFAPKERIVSSLSWHMSWRATRATIMFSSWTASRFMALRTSSSDCVVKLFPAARVRSFHSWSSQHSRS